MFETETTNPVTAEELAEELEAHLDLFLRICPAEPTYCSAPAVVPAGPGRFAARDPSTVNPTSPRDWSGSNNQTGPATREGQTRKIHRPTPGKPYPKGHPSARLYTEAEIAEIAATVDTNDGSPLDLAHQVSEGLYGRIVEAAKAAGVEPGWHTAFVVKFVVAKLSDGYFKERTDEHRAAHLERVVKSAVAALGFKRDLIREYEAKIAVAEAEEDKRLDAPEDARLAALEDLFSTQAKTIEQLAAQLAALSPPPAPPA